MERLEAQHRLFNAIQILIRQGWTQKQVDALIGGLQREDAVETAERYAEDALLSAHDQALEAYDRETFGESQ